MSGKRIQLKRGTTAQNSTFTGLNGEVTVDTTKKTLVVHDGTTIGGTVLAKDSDVVLKVDKVVGKQLSTEDYTTAEKSKLSGIASGANNYIHPASGVGAGTYRSVTVDTNGHITAGTNPTTVSGYGLTDVHTKTEVNTLLALKINNSEKGVANGVATLDANGKVMLTQIPDSVLGQLEYMGTWNFTTMPTATQKGQYWIASISGNGYVVGDWAVWNGLSFDKVDNTNAVASVSGRTGNVVLTKSDVGLDLVNNTTDISKNVLSATKLTTTRNIALSGDIAGNVNFDGSANASITTAIQSGVIINADINASAGIIDTKLATISTAGKVLNSATTATNLNTASAIVARDASGDFAAGIITASLNGNAATATTLATSRNLTIGSTAKAFNGSLDVAWSLAEIGAQPVDADLTAIGALAGTSGLLKKTAANTWILDTSAYVTSSGVTSVGATLPLTSTGGNTPTLAINAATTIAAGSMSASDKTKLDGITTGANVNVTTDLSTTYNTSNVIIVSSDGLDATINSATSSLAGVLSSTDKTKLDGIASGATANIGTVTSVATSGAITGGTITGTGTISHSSADGFLHVPVTGTTNNGKVLTAGATAGSFSWVTPTSGVTDHTLLSNIGTNTHTQIDIALTRLANTSGTNTGDQTITLTGDVAGSGTGSFTTTLANSGVTAGTYSKVTVDGKGRVTSGSTQTMEDIPDATFKRSVRAATTANITLSAPQTIDGIALVAGDRVLVKDQTTTSQNGIYVVAAGAWTRSLDADTSSKIASALVAVDSGTANGGKLFDNDFKTTDTLGTTAMLWSSNLDSGHLLASTSTSIGAVAYNGTTAAVGKFDGGTTTPTGTARLNYGGYFYPTYLNLLGSADTATASSHVFVETAFDGFVRPKTLANFKTEMFASPTLVTPNIGVATGTSFNSITGLASVAPLAAGTAAVGTSTLAARQDHVHPVQTSVSGNAGTATTLATGRNIGTTGDVIGTATSFNGSTDINITTALSVTGIAAGTYRSITVDAKGRATAGTNPTTLAGFGIADAYTKTDIDLLIGDINSALDTINGQVI